MGSKNAKAMPSAKPKPAAGPRPPAEPDATPTVHGYSRTYGGEVTLPAGRAPSGGYPALYNGSPFSCPTAGPGYGSEYGGQPYSGYQSYGYGHQCVDEVIPMQYIHQTPCTAPPQIFSSYRF